MVGGMTEDLGSATPGEQPPTLEDIWKKQYLPADQKPPLVAQPYVPPASSVPRPSSRNLGLGFVAAAVVALIGGVAWAAISVATGYNLGILAFFIGAATGYTAQLVAGGPIGGFERGVAGVFAAAAVVIGDYVIVIHEVRVHQSSFFIEHGVSVPGYLDANSMSAFIHHFGTFVHGMDWLWIAIAAYAAIRTTGGRLGPRRS